MIQTIAYPWVPGRMKGVVAASNGLGFRPVPHVQKSGARILIVPADVDQIARSLAYLYKEYPEPPQRLH